MKLLTKVEFLNRVPNDDVYVISIEALDEKRVFHVMSYSEELDNRPGANEPTFLYIPEDTTIDDLWNAIGDQLDEVKLYGGPFDPLITWQGQYEKAFLCDDSIIIKVENTREALSILKIIAATYPIDIVNMSPPITIVV